MSVELLQTLSTVFFIASAVLFLISLALFFLMDIIHIVGDVTGSTARKAIEDIRKGNEATGNKAYKPSPVNKARGKLTDKISPSGQLIQRTAGLGVSTGTAKLSTEELIPKTDETTVLNAVSDETTVLSVQSNETTVLTGALNETTVLCAPPVEEVYIEAEHNDFVLNLEMGFIGSTEIIE